MPVPLSKKELESVILDDDSGLNLSSSQKDTSHDTEIKLRRKEKNMVSLFGLFLYMHLS